MNDEHKEEHAHDEINDIELELMNTSLNDKAERKCANCKADETKNHCNKCMQNFCSDCEVEVEKVSLITSKKLHMKTILFQIRNYEEELIQSRILLKSY